MLNSGWRLQQPPFLLIAQEQMHQRSVCHLCGRDAVSQQFISKTLPVHQEVICAIAHSMVPHVEQPSIECSGVWVEVVDRVANGYALCPQGPNE